MDHDHSHHMHHAAPTPVNETSTAMPAHHDHSMHSGMDHMHGTGGSNEMLHHMMSMAFHGGYNETILFKQWTISSCSGLIWSMLAIFLMGVFYEGLKYYRESLFWKSYNALQYRQVTVPEKNAQVVDEQSRVVHMVGEVIHKQPPTIFSMMHFYQSFLHLVQVTVSFMLMLIFMTYNTYLCLAVVIGAAVGYFSFGWKKSVVVDVTEHCH